MKALELILVAWLPGAVLFRIPTANRRRRAQLRLEERAFWAIVLSCGVSLLAGMLLGLAGHYSFRNLAIIDAGVACGAAIASRFDLRLGAEARRIDAGVVLALVLVALGFWRFFPPAEYVIGGKDPGTYMNEHRRTERDRRAAGPADRGVSTQPGRLL